MRPLHVITNRKNFARSDLILDRSRKLVGLQSPTDYATCAGGDSHPSFKNCGRIRA